MNNKNTYLDKILTLPSKKIINQWFRTNFLFIIIFIPGIFLLCYEEIPQNIIIFLKVFIMFFIILSIIFKFLIKKFPHLIFIYISISFGIFSLVSFIISCMKIYDIEVFGSPFNVLFLLLAIILYLFEIIFVSISFINKEILNSNSAYTGYILSRSSISIFATLGVLTSYYISSTILNFIILIFSYITLLIFLVGINRFRLLLKFHLLKP